MTLHGRHPLVLVAAVARNGVIGAAGAMPWCLPGDLARFRATTMGHPLLMGRTTYESIGRPLPGRLTTVLSRTIGFSPPGVSVAASLPEGLASADGYADELGAAAIMVVGGATVYAATIALAQTLLITEVTAEPEGDVRFPPINPDNWQRTQEQDVLPRSDDRFSYRFVRWDRKPPR